MNLAELTRQLAEEAGVDVRSVAASLERHESTRDVGAELRRGAARGELEPRDDRRAGPPAPRGGGPPAPRGGPLSIAWWQEPIVWVPMPWRPGSSVGISPLLVLVGWLAWRAWRGQSFLPDFLQRRAS